MIYIIFALILVVKLWLDNNNDDYIYVGMLFAIVFFKDYERAITVFVGLILVMILWREYKSKNGVFELLFRKIKIKKSQGGKRDGRS